MSDLFGKNYIEKLRNRASKKRLPPSKSHALTEEIINYFGLDLKKDFRSIFFGVIRNGIGYQGAFDALREMQRRESKNVKYWWGIVRNDKKKIQWK